MISSIDLKMLSKYSKRDLLDNDDILSLKVLSKLGLLRIDNTRTIMTLDGNSKIYVTVTQKGKFVLKDNRIKLIYIRIKDFLKSIFWLYIKTRWLS